MDKTQVNAALVKRFGPTVTRQQLLDYQTETGINARWIRRDDALRVSPGVYRVPVAEAAPMRPVMPTPFDEDVLAASIPKKKTREAAPADVVPVVDADYGPSGQKFIYMRALVCITDYKHARRPWEYDEATHPPLCPDCGSRMAGHGWSPRRAGQPIMKTA